MPLRKKTQGWALAVMRKTNSLGPGMSPGTWNDVCLGTACIAGPRTSWHRESKERVLGLFSQLATPLPCPSTIWKMEIRPLLATELLGFAHEAPTALEEAALV